jgi:uncharacterized cysteine cluster protein YcgN (CxxCxxCC family)
MRFWETKSLAEMSTQEWESLCDGCGRCCLAKLEDAATGSLHYTNVACRLLDTTTCRCTRYATRTSLVRDCIALSPEDLATLAWMPASCAYRIVHEGRPLPWWHPLISGDPHSVHAAGISVRGRCESETLVDDDLEFHLVDWIDTHT